MNLSAVIPASRVTIVESAASKKAALEIISHQLADGNEQRQKAIFDALVNRERLGSTGLGEGVAIPHGRINGITEPVGCLVKLQQAVGFDASDDQDVDLIAGLAVPADCTEEHLQVLAAVARAFSNNEFTQAARQANSAEALAAALATAE